VKKSRHKLLVAQSFIPRRDFEPLKRYGEVYWLEDMDERQQERVLPWIDCIYSLGWPRALEAKVPKMRSLRFFQTGPAGRRAIENLERYFKGRRLKNVVDRSEYV